MKKESFYKRLLDRLKLRQRVKAFFKAITITLFNRKLISIDKCKDAYLIYPAPTYGYLEHEYTYAKYAYVEFQKQTDKEERLKINFIKQFESFEEAKLKLSIMGLDILEPEPYDGTTPSGKKVRFNFHPIQKLNYDSPNSKA